MKNEDLAYFSSLFEKQKLKGTAYLSEKEGYFQNEKTFCIKKSIRFILIESQSTLTLSKHRVILPLFANTERWFVNLDISKMYFNKN